MKKYLKPETEFILVDLAQLCTASEQVQSLQEEVNSDGVQEGNSSMTPNARRGNIWDDED